MLRSLESQNRGRAPPLELPRDDADGASWRVETIQRFARILECPYWSSELMIGEKSRLRQATAAKENLRIGQG